MSADAPKPVVVDEKPPVVHVVSEDGQRDVTKEEELGVASQVDDPSVIRRILRKTDLNLITLLGLVGMMSSLGKPDSILASIHPSDKPCKTDRTNIGNANLTGFSTDLGLVDNQFGAAVSVVYSTYIVFEPIWNVMLKIVGPKILLTCSCLSWALLTIGGAFVKNYTQLLVVRILLGAAEAAVVPGIFMYCSMAYNREEQAVRQSYVTVFSAMAGGFGGLLAFGLTQISTPNMHGWQWLYLVEGLMSMILVPIIWFRLPNAISEAPWLNKTEKAIMEVRMERNKGAYNKDEKFDKKEVFRALTDWRVWGQGIMQFGINTTFFACELAFFLQASQLPTVAGARGDGLIRSPSHTFTSYHMWSPCLQCHPNSDQLHASHHCGPRLHQHCQCATTYSAGLLPLRPVVPHLRAHIRPPQAAFSIHRRRSNVLFDCLHHSRSGQYARRRALLRTVLAGRQHLQHGKFPTTPRYPHRPNKANSSNDNDECCLVLE